MRCVKSIFTVSIFAMLVVTGARAEIVSKTNIVAGTNVTIENPTSGTNSGKIVISATDTNTTYTTGTEAYSGTTKLYTSTGTSTDGTMTRGAITTALGAKEDVANKVTNTSSYDEDSKEQYPSMAVANQMAKKAAAQNAAGKLDKVFQNNKNQVMITTATGAVTPTTVDTDGEGNAVTAVTVAGGKYTVTKGETFATKAQLDTVQTTASTAVQTVAPTSATAGKYVTNFTKSGTTVTATTAYVQIPVGSATAPTSVASIWVE